MVKLISNDGATVKFSPTAAQKIPYIRDAYWDFNALQEDDELPACFATGAQLAILKQMFEVQDTASSFIPISKPVKLGEFSVQVSLLVSPSWSPALDSFFQSLSEDQIIDLLTVAHSMCISELRQGLVILLLHKMLMHKWEFSRFFESANNNLLKAYISSMLKSENYQRLSQ
jgi:hypothetical protein